MAAGDVERLQEWVVDEGLGGVGGMVGVECVACLDWSLSNLDVMSSEVRLQLGFSRAATSFLVEGGESFLGDGEDWLGGAVVIWLGTVDFVVCGRRRLKGRERGGCVMEAG